MATAQQLGTGDAGGDITVKHLRYAHLPEEELREIFFDIILSTLFLREVFTHAQELDLPNWRVVSGALYNVIWNHLTGRDPDHGIKDVDLFYFEADQSWDAENRVIKSASFPPYPPVEIRNQARVHLWYSEKFGHEIPPMTSVENAIDVFTTKTHCVGLRIVDGVADLYAPHGLRDIFSMRAVPNPIRPNRETFETKNERHLQMWPELTILPWPN